MTAPDRQPGLSARADEASNAGIRIEYLIEHDLRVNGPSPDPGYVSLAVAENKLMWDVLDRKVNAARHVPESALGYDDWQGNLAFREALAAFLGRRLHRSPVDPAHIQVMAGAGALVESVAWTVCDPGTGVLIPTPSYAGYWFDIGARTGVVPIPAHTTADEDFRVTEAALSRAERQAGVPIRLLLLTNPSNPLGRILTDNEIHTAVRWARTRGIHVVINEIYALSTYGAVPFRSAASLGYGDQPDIHLLWAFSKDFSASGLRCGVLVTSNEEVRRSVGTFGYFHGVSGDTQHLLRTMITDDGWVDNYLSTLSHRLRTSSERALEILGTAGVGAIAPDAGIFFLADLRNVMDEVSWEAEARLWRRILDGADVNLTPGSACHVGEPGFMRVCFAAQPIEVMAESITRVVQAIGAP